MKTAQEMLEELDEFFIHADSYNQKQLWKILTGLRGPDSDNEDVKLLTTARIRAVALPRSEVDSLVGWKVGYTGATSNPDAERVETDKITDSEHFLSHVWQAVSALREMGRVI